VKLETTDSRKTHFLSNISFPQTCTGHGKLRIQFHCPLVLCDAGSDKLDLELCVRVARSSSLYTGSGARLAVETRPEVVRKLFARISATGAARPPRTHGVSGQG